MLALTSIVGMSMALIVSTYPSKSIDAALIVFFSTVTGGLCLSLLIYWNENRETERERKNASAGSEEKDLP
jgi:FtsH-binding integral membrane protein